MMECNYRNESSETKGSHYSSMPDRNVDRSKLETRLGFADIASQSKIWPSQLVSYHASHYINFAVSK